MSTIEGLPDIPWRDRMMAHAGARLSRLCIEHPSVGDRIIGGDDRVERVQYDVVTDVTQAGEGTWAEYDPDPEGPTLPIPSRYRWVGWTSIDSRVLERNLAANGPEDRLALAFRVGKATVAATLSDRHIWYILRDGGYGMRIGGGTDRLKHGLKTTVAVQSPAHGTVVVSKGIVFPEGKVFKLREDSGPEDMKLYDRYPIF